MDACASASICGVIEKHASEKKELSDLCKKKQKIESEVKALKNDLAVKKKVVSDVRQSFETKVHDILINSNPQKYLTTARRPKEGIVLADSYMLKKYYGITNKSVTISQLEQDSEMFKFIIEDHEEKMKTKTIAPKNVVQRQLEMQGVQIPTAPFPMFPNPYNPWFVPTPGPFMPPGSYPPPCASPPPPPEDEIPPLPENEQTTQNHSG